MKKVLVVCYSRTGTALQLARELTVALGADLEQIEDARARSGKGGYIRSAFEALSRGLPSIRTRKDPADYDLVVLGTPVWTGSMASPMRSYLFSHRKAIKKFAAFAVMGGAGAEGALQEIRALCGDENAPSCAFAEREVKAGRHRQRLAEFAAVLVRARDQSATSAAA